MQAARLTHKPDDDRSVLEGTGVHSAASTAPACAKPCDRCNRRCVNCLRLARQRHGPALAQPQPQAR